MEEEAYEVVGRISSLYLIEVYNTQYSRMQFRGAPVLRLRLSTTVQDQRLLICFALFATCLQRSREPESFNRIRKCIGELKF